MNKLVLFFVLANIHFAFTQIGTGQWRRHISPIKAIAVDHSQESIYTALSKGLLTYDLESGEQTLRTSANYLSDNTLTDIYFHSASKRLYIGYDNGNLDILENEAILNMNAIQISQISGSKKINKIKGYNNEIYLATGFGIVVINDSKLEVKDTYFPTSGNQEIIDLAFVNNNIYALTNNGVYIGELANNFLADPSQWAQLSWIPDYSSLGNYKSISGFNNTIFLAYNDDLYNGDTLFSLNLTSESLTPFLIDVELNSTNAQGDKLLISTDGGLFSYNSDLNLEQLIYQYVHGTFPNCMDAVNVNGYYFIADRSSGLVRAPDAFNSTQILFEGPDNNFSYRIDWAKGRLAVAGGPGDRAGYSFYNEDWKSTNMFSQTMLQSSAIPGFLSVAVNPKNVEQIAFGSFSEMPLALTNDGQSISDTFGIYNSLLEIRYDAASSGLIWSDITDMEYDSRGNLWVANSGCQRPLKVLDSEGVWHDFELGTTSRNKFTKRIAVDQNGIKWLAIKDAGLYAFDDNQTINDPSDDRYRLLNSGEFTGNLPSANIEALAVDLDNNIWIGTEEGMRVLYNSADVFDAGLGEYNFQRLLIEYGENVEIVLGTTHITDIEIDGGNRKWFGTAGAGVFIFSEDGLTLIENFTKENSPLLSNNILDMSIDDNTGEVYIVTDEGLISYRGDATNGDISYSNVKVFPNPVHPTYFGPVTIQGIASNSEVKITDVAGNLVYRTASNGGTATWDVTTTSGDRASTGVYLIWTSVDNENIKGREVGKVVVIN